MSKVLVLEYGDDFIDNMSNYACAKILEQKADIKCMYPNDPSKRLSFESSMSDFNLKYSYLSVARAQDIAKQSYINSLNIEKKSFNKIAHKLKKDSYLTKTQLTINDVNLLNEDIKNDLKFNNNDFLFNYDILETIQTTNSICMYVDDRDLLNIDTEFIYNALERLNKYLIKPKFYIFSKTHDVERFSDVIETKNILIDNKKEILYLISKARNIIVPNIEYSYSLNLLAAILNDLSFGHIIYAKDKYIKSPNHKWIAC